MVVRPAEPSPQSIYVCVCVCVCVCVRAHVCVQEKKSKSVFESMCVAMFACDLASECGACFQGEMWEFQDKHRTQMPPRVQTELMKLSFLN